MEYICSGCGSITNGKDWNGGGLSCCPEREPINLFSGAGECVCGYFKLQNQNNKLAEENKRLREAVMLMEEKIKNKELRNGFRNRFGFMDICKKERMMDDEQDSFDAKNEQADELRQKIANYEIVVEQMVNTLLRLNRQVGVLALDENIRRWQKMVK